MKRHTLFLLAVVLAWFCGCATTGDLDRVRQTGDQRVTALKAEVDKLGTQLARIEKELAEAKEANAALRKSQADASADMIGLRDGVQNLRGSVDEIKKEFSSVQKNGGLKEKLDDLTFRVEYIESFIGVSKKEAPAAKGEGKAPAAAAGAAETKADKESAYQGAYKTFKEGKYGKAREEFSAFLKQHPKTDLSDNAQFWIGECYYLEGNYEKAILEYEKVIKNFASGDKVADAMLKQGMSFQKLGDKQSAKLIYQQVAKKHPKSNQAKIASAKLKELK